MLDIGETRPAHVAALSNLCFVRLGHGVDGEQLRRLHVLAYHTSRDPILDSPHGHHSIEWGQKLVDWWLLIVLATPTTGRKGTSLVVILTTWWLWKRRKAVIFDSVHPDLGGLVDEIKTEARSWVAIGSSGLAAILLD
jgi:hypothetical protein